MTAAGCGASVPGPPTAASTRQSSTTSTSQGLTAGPYGAPGQAGPSASGPSTTAASDGGTTPTSAAPPTTAAPAVSRTTTTRPSTTTTTASTTTTVRSTTTTTTARTASASDTSGGLTITLSASPASAPAGTTVQFTVTAYETHAPGALVYQLSYGDGGSDQNTAPTTCRGGTAGPAQQTWHLSHRYGQKGSFFAHVTVKANCTSDQASATVTITAT